MSENILNIQVEPEGKEQIEMIDQALSAINLNETIESVDIEEVQVLSDAEI